ncbi:hypothetical protein RHMOL_Rhmol13G0104600 [Rhododendron molle]|uniref:Uncharacterized protein n=1 Tax=Rhododendron molle TaxID=49168 RepID=A0ACC0L663_RHOML|nr:hypothetical protein RHMOL_Rhmol13G0104600 [Rhododendron molle]
MSPPAATSRTSAYLSALTLEIQKKLQRVRPIFSVFPRLFGADCMINRSIGEKTELDFVRRCCFFQALASPSQRRNLLQELFADVALENIYLCHEVLVLLRKGH